MDNSPHIEELRQLLARGEPQASKAARLRPLLPRIVQRLNAGAPRRVIVQQLNQAGLAVSLHDLAKQLQRYRRQRQHDQNNTGTTPIPPALQPSPLNRSQCSPAELRQIRHMHVDLEALRREGEQQRRQNTPSVPPADALRTLSTTTPPSPATDTLA